MNKNMYEFEQPQTHTPLQRVALGLAVTAIMSGIVGMGLSFIFLAMMGMENITAGVAGFVAGALFIASGLLSLTLLSVHSRQGQQQF